MTIQELIDSTRSWAHDRNLIEGSDRKSQCVKLAEEFGELAGGIARGKEDVINDSIGDMVVVLIIIAAQGNMSFERCVAEAYETIKDRKGRMVDGVFVRDCE